MLWWSISTSLNTNQDVIGKMEYLIIQKVKERLLPK